MRTTERIRKDDEMPGSFDAYSFPDWHVGNELTDYGVTGRFKRVIKAGKHRYSMHPGDMCETIAPDDKRFQIAAHHDRLDAQIAHIVSLLEPIADRILVIGVGNHELREMNRYDITDEICRRLNVPYGGYECRVFFPTFKAHLWHGRGTCNPKAGDHAQIERNKQIWVKRKLRKRAGDCEVQLMGHIHQMVISEPDREALEMLDDGTRLREYYTNETVRHPAMKGAVFIPEDYRWYAACGSALRMFSEPGLLIKKNPSDPKERGMHVIPYTETIDATPTELGCIKMTVKNDKLIGLSKVPLGA